MLRVRPPSGPNEPIQPLPMADVGPTIDLIRRISRLARKLDDLQILADDVAHELSRVCLLLDSRSDGISAHRLGPKPYSRAKLSQATDSAVETFPIVVDSFEIVHEQPGGGGYRVRIDNKHLQLTAALGALLSLLASDLGGAASADEFLPSWKTRSDLAKQLHTSVGAVRQLLHRLRNFLCQNNLGPGLIQRSQKGYRLALRRTPRAVAIAMTFVNARDHENAKPPQ